MKKYRLKSKYKQLLQTIFIIISFIYIITCNIKTIDDLNTAYIILFIMIITLNNLYKSIIKESIRQRTTPTLSKNK